MTPEEIDAELARPIERVFPRTLADALAFVFAQDAAFRGTIDGMRGVTPADTTTMTFTTQLTTRTEVAQAYLRRLQAIEARGEPREHDLFKKL